jgi:SAM-dependent methyltransferase
MRRLVLAAGVVGILGGALWARRARRSEGPKVPGVLPGRLGSWVNAYLDRPFHAEIARMLDLRADDELLDVACGAGYFLTRSASHVRHVAGLDLSGPKVEIARRRLADRIAAGSAEIVQGEAGSLPWEDARFTALSCMDAFPFFPQPDRALAEMCRVLRPGGRVVVDVNPTVPEGVDSHMFRGPAGRFWAWNDTDVRHKLEAAGFERVSIAHVRMGGESDIGNRLTRRIFGTDEETIVLAVRPAVPASDEVRTEETVAAR